MQCVLNTYQYDILDVLRSNALKSNTCTALSLHVFAALSSVPVHLSPQIYAFGTVSVYLDQSVAFTETPRGSGRWAPLRLEDLLALTGHTPAAAAAAPGTTAQKNADGSHGFGGLD